MPTEQKQPYVIDAAGKALGRIATEAATLLRGKHAPDYTPYHIPKQRVVIINAAKLTVSGSKRTTKIYTRYSGYPSGLKRISFERMFAKDPRRVLRHAIRGMLPANKLRSRMITNLTIHYGEREN